MDEPSPRKKIFTVDEANQLLPRVIPLVEQLQGLQRSIVRINEDRDLTKAKLSGGNGHPPQELKAELDKMTKRQLHLLEAFQSVVKQLEELGAVLKDVSMGLVDFYGLRNGEPVLLCWRLGEERVTFWHGLQEGFAGRQPIDGV